MIFYYVPLALLLLLCASAVTAQSGSGQRKMPKYSKDDIDLMLKMHNALRNEYCVIKNLTWNEKLVEVSKKRINFLRDKSLIDHTGHDKNYGENLSGGRQRIHNGEDSHKKYAETSIQGWIDELEGIAKENLIKNQHSQSPFKIKYNHATQMLDVKVSEIGCAYIEEGGNWIFLCTYDILANNSGCTYVEYLEDDSCHHNFSGLKKMGGGKDLSSTPGYYSSDSRSKRAPNGQLSLENCPNVEGVVTELTLNKGGSKQTTPVNKKPEESNGVSTEVEKTPPEDDKIEHRVFKRQTSQEKKKDNESNDDSINVDIPVATSSNLQTGCGRQKSQPAADNMSAEPSS